MTLQPRELRREHDQPGEHEQQARAGQHQQSHADEKQNRSDDGDHDALDCHVHQANPAEPVNRAAAARVLRVMGRMHRELLAVALLGGVLAGCSSEDPEPAASPSPSVSPPVTGTVEQIASRLDCTPEIRVQAAELRQGMCGTEDALFAVVTFPADKFRDVWLYEAAGFGGWYVVGPGWVVSASTKEQATARQKKLGGSLVDGSVVPKTRPPS